MRLRFFSSGRELFIDEPLSNDSVLGALHCMGTHQQPPAVDLEESTAKQQQRRRQRRGSEGVSFPQADWVRMVRARGSLTCSSRELAAAGRAAAQSKATFFHFGSSLDSARRVLQADVKQEGLTSGLIVPADRCTRPKHSACLCAGGDPVLVPGILCVGSMDAAN